MCISFTFDICVLFLLHFDLLFYCFLQQRSTNCRSTCQSGRGSRGRRRWALESIARFLFTLYFPVQLKECVCACFSFFFASLFLMSCALCFLKVKENYALNMFGTGQFDILAPWKSWEQNRKANNESTTSTQQVQLHRVQLNNNCRKKNKTLAKQKQKNVKIGESEKEGRGQKKRNRDRQT